MKKQDYLNLVSQVKAHDYHYFIENSPLISDAEYDKLYFNIQQVEEQHPEWIVPDSPTQFAHGEKKNGHMQIRRRTPMLSTEKAQSIASVVKWCNRTIKAGCEDLYTVEWKYDGVSCSLVYIDGILTEASYGKGIDGNDCMATAKLAQGVPGQIETLSHRVEIRGEMVVPFKEFDRLKDYKNCRSAAQGILSDNNTKLAHALWFLPYEVIGVETTDMCNGRTVSNADIIGNLPGIFSCHCEVHVVEKDGLASLIEKMTEQRSSLAFPTDGLVIKVYDVSKWESLGATAHHNHYAIAYKFPPSYTAETVCTGITYTVGDTGRVTYIAHFSPVVLNGCDYTHASVGTEKSLQKKGIAVGARLIVGLSNDVTVQVLSVLSGGTEETPLSSPSSVETTRYSESAKSKISGDSFGTILPLINDALHKKQEDEVQATTDTPRTPGFSGFFFGALSIVAVFFLAAAGLSIAAFGLPLLCGIKLKE